MRACYEDRANTHRMEYNAVANFRYEGAMRGCERKVVQLGQYDKWTLKSSSYLNVYPVSLEQLWNRLSLVSNKGFGTVHLCSRLEAPTVTVHLSHTSYSDFIQVSVMVVLDAPVLRTLPFTTVIPLSQTTRASTGRI